ncbi:GDP-mannose 4,6-dehydratase [Candidatus Woesearchaeota archaeon]|nr:GDP-mannose 4,6-dehydratase [Candidatus Woesearchaeota archaeon]
MRALVTGASGFAGQHLCDCLSKRGCDVSGTYHINPSKRWASHRLNILDKDGFKDVLAKAKPDVVFHLAGMSSVRESFENPKLCFETNVTGTKNLMESLIELKQIPKVVVVSSSEVYAPSDNSLNEISPPGPKTPYGKSKLAQEELCHQYSPKAEIVILRSFTHIGPGQRDVFFMSNFAKQIAEIEAEKREPIIKVGDLCVKRDITDVRDIAAAYCLAAEKAKPGETYNVCSGKAYLLKDLLDKLIEISGIEVEVRVDKKRLRETDRKLSIGDNSKFVKATGWKPKVPIRQTMKDTLDYWRKRI